MSSTLCVGATLRSQIIQAPQSHQPKGNGASGFGFMNTLTPGFTGALVPRNGLIVARFTF
jgi:hypothetical protein